MAVTITAPPKGLPALDLSNVAQHVQRKDVDARHPDWSARQELWFNVYVLYEGGHLIKQHAERFLMQRPREDAKVYAYRLAHFCYENNLGTGLGWHEAEMFKQPPTLDIKVAGADGKATDADLSPDQTDFYTRFQKDCDRHGTGLVDKYRQVFTDLLLYQTSWLLTDMPVQDAATPVTSLADQKANHLLDPYVTVVSPLSVINWESDEYGNLQWAVIYSKTATRSFTGPVVDLERWFYYDRQTYRVYEAEVQADSRTVDADKQPVQLVRAGYHALAGKNRVPLQVITVPAGWWMGNRTYLAAMEHVDVSNALKWSLKMAALAMPVVITDDDVSTLMQSEAGFIKLGKDSDYKFAEPSGACWEHLARRAEVLKEEIWRSLYLIAQSRTTSATASAQSGVSKQQDMKPSHDVLNGIGDVLRAAIQATLQNVVAARALIPGNESDASLLFDVRGFQFEDAVTIDQVDTVSGVHALQVPSKTFEKEVDKLVVQAVLPDMNPETRAVIFEEIDSAPTREEKAQAQKEEEAKRMAASLDAAVGA